jgi:hypothetical protein
MQWSVSHGVLTLFPRQYNVGWIEAPFRSTRSGSFAIEAVVRFSKRQPPRNWGWTGGLYLIAHFHPPFQTQNGFQTGKGVSGAYIFGEISGVGILDSGTSQGTPVDFNKSVEWHHGSWTTFRLEVHAGAIQSDGTRQDTYSFQINGVRVASATLRDWLQYDRIAIASRFGLDVKSLKVYRLP